jgi:hypothetical protein
MNLSEPVMAALIGATATFITAMFQLVLNARRQAAERAAGKPATRKTGTWLAIFALMLAAGVGGYAYAEYRLFSNREDDKALRQEMQASLRGLGDVAARLERAGAQRGELGEGDTKAAAERRLGLDGVSAIVELPPCTGPSSGQDASACTESNPVRVAVCAPVPAAATITQVRVFTRADDSPQAWADASNASAQEAGNGKVVDAFYERVQADAKEICQRFIHWNSQKGRAVRIVVRYSL